jgi:hypothetical protein
MRKKPQQSENYDAAETVRRRDEAVRKALNTPPKPYKESKVGNTGKKQPASRRKK